jgi:hypothetical protein
MIFDPSLHIYIPVAYVLMTGKTKECYWQAFNWLRSEVKDCVPYCVGVDFEWNFWKSVLEFFPETKLIGCLFHFKQATRKKMVELGIPNPEIAFAMKSGVLDLLTVIPQDELNMGINFVRDVIQGHIRDLKEEDPEYEGIDDPWDYFFDEYFKR